MKTKTFDELDDSAKRIVHQKLKDEWSKKNEINQKLKEETEKL